MAKIESESDARITTVKSSNRTNVWENVIDIDEDLSPKKTIKEVVEISRSAFAAGKSRSLKFRKDQLKKLLKFLEDEKKCIADAIYKVSDIHFHNES
ncbi:hypothetical protein JTB14_010931 [Gonioctena quinquepunctata]|nr:hypothetical protein JTB14_010931 [Gonioctena quinquepunctata]